MEYRPHRRFYVVIGIVDSNSNETTIQGQFFDIDEMYRTITDENLERHLTNASGMQGPFKFKCLEGKDFLEEYLEDHVQEHFNKLFSYLENLAD